jgi:4-carboxymuconolactone decarboxylase
MPAHGKRRCEGVRQAVPGDAEGLLEMWFGKTFNPKGWTPRRPVPVTIAALTVLGPVGEPQMRMTIKNALAAGATKREIAEVIWQMSMFGGLPAMQKALEIAQPSLPRRGERRMTVFSLPSTFRRDHGGRRA